MNPVPSIPTSKLEPLLVALRSRQLAIFVGAGVSRAGGLPTWTGLIEQLLAGARALQLPDESQPALRRAADKLGRGNLLGALDELKLVLAGAELTSLVIRALDDRPHPVPEAAVLLGELATGDRDVGLHSLVTTNLDRFLERATKGIWPHHVIPPYHLAQSGGYILKLHGDLNAPDSWVLTRSQYEQMITHPGVLDFLKGLYLNRVLLFVGYGLHDPDFDMLLGWIRTFAKDHPPQHYALMAAGSVDATDRRALAEAGIEILGYANPAGDHAALVETLRALVPSRAASATITPVTPPGPDAPVSPPTPIPPRAMSMELTPIERLAKLLKTLYSADELRRFMTHLGDDLAEELPAADASLAKLATESAGLLISRAKVHDALDRMRSDRPRRVDLIEGVRQYFPC